jgi:glycosyltransferase involved in cell wall biosynthesis
MRKNIHEKKRLFVVIPALNEARVIGSVIQSLRKNGIRNIIVVDDGSSDATYEKAVKQKVCVVRHFINRGKGAAIKTGIALAKKLGADVTVTFDGDGQHDARDIEKMMQKIGEGYDVVLGSRFLQEQSIPFIKRVGNTLANFITYILYGIWVTDSQSGLRAYTRKSYELIDMQNARYEVESEILREIKHHTLRYIEIPMRVRYTRYSQTKTNKQNLWSGIMTMVRLMFSA